MREETGIALGESDLVQRFHLYIRLSYNNFEYVVFSVTLPECPEILLSKTEHTEARWVTLVEALAMPLMEDEDACVKLLYGIA